MLQVLSAVVILLAAANFLARRVQRRRITAPLQFGLPEGVDVAGNHAGQRPVSDSAAQPVSSGGIQVSTARPPSTGTFTPVT